MDKIIRWLVRYYRPRNKQIFRTYLTQKLNEDPINFIKFELDKLKKDPEIYEQAMAIILGAND